MIGNRRSLATKALAGALVALVAGCATPAPPPPPPPPVVIAPRPVPPLGAQGNLAVPPKGPDGARQTVNAHVSPDQAVWNVRAAFNVAALNCMDPKYAEILPAYASFLKVHKAELAKANKTVDDEYKAKYGKSGYLVPREAYMTQVYNYFALPPTIANFCEASLQMARDSATVPKGGLDDFAVLELPRLEAVFDGFFTAYETYQSDLAAWNAKYDPQPTVPSAPSAYPPAQPTGTLGAAPIPAPVAGAGH